MPVLHPRSLLLSVRLRIFLHLLKTHVLLPALHSALWTDADGQDQDLGPPVPGRCHKQLLGRLLFELLVSKSFHCRAGHYTRRLNSGGSIYATALALRESFSGLWSQPSQLVRAVTGRAQGSDGGSVPTSPPSAAASAPGQHSSDLRSVLTVASEHQCRGQGSSDGSSKWVHPKRKG